MLFRSRSPGSASKPDRLALIFEADPGERFQLGRHNLSSVRPGTFQDWREQLRSFETMAAVQDTRATIMSGDRARSELQPTAELESS